MHKIESVTLLFDICGIICDRMMKFTYYVYQNGYDKVLLYSLCKGGTT